MAKTKKSKSAQQKTKMTQGRSVASSQTPEQLYADALQLIEQGQPSEALKVAKKLHIAVQGRPALETLPALNLLGDISIELGAAESAREYFLKAVELDPNGEVSEASLSGGAEKFLWLAQLSEEGGKESVDWFERGAKALQNEIAAIESGRVAGLDAGTLQLLRAEKKRKLANTLCGVVEVYMTDLSWEDDAEARCESLITQAMAIEDETSSEVLQCLASVRLSQDRKEDAQAALKRSLEAWVDLEPEDPAVPDFATKIQLSRLLMEADLNVDAMVVLDRQIQEDDQSVEAWYLGGWCQYLLAEDYKAGSVPARPAADTSTDESADQRRQRLTTAALKGSRRWLNTALKLFAQQDYEDQRLFDHAHELVAGLDSILGPAEGEDADNDGEADYEHWEGIEENDGEEDGEGEDDEDEHMADS